MNRGLKKCRNEGHENIEVVEGHKEREEIVGDNHEKPQEREEDDDVKGKEEDSKTMMTWKTPCMKWF